MGGCLFPFLHPISALGGWENLEAEKGLQFLFAWSIIRDRMCSYTVRAARPVPGTEEPQF